MSGSDTRLLFPGIEPAGGEASSPGGVRKPEDLAFLAMAQSAARMGHWSWDLTADTIWRSAELYRVHGVSPGALGHRLEDYLAFIHPEDQARVSEAAGAAWTGHTVPVEYRFVHPEGGVRHLLGTSALVRDRTGKAQQLVGTVQDVTEIMGARRSVSDAFTRLSAYFEEMPTPAYLWRKEGEDLVLRRFNKAARERWGATSDELTGTTARVLCADRPDVIADIEACLESKSSVTRETDWVSADKGRRRLVVTYVPVGTDSVVAHAEDISELLAVTQREERAMVRLAEYFQRVPTPAYLWRETDGDLILEAANHAGVEATRGRIAEHIGVSAEVLYADRPDVVDDLRRALRGDTFTREYPYETRSTRELQELVVTYVHIPPDAVAAHIVDVTEQRLMEAAVRESHEASRGIMEGNPDGICLIADGRITACNGSLSALMGCADDALIGRRLHDLMVPQDRDRAESRGRAILRGGASEPSEYTLQRCDGSAVPVEIFSAAFEFRGQPALVCTLRDISRRKEAERELAESRDALRALTQHLESVREEERMQVARDLHDELGSVLTALKIDLAELGSAVPADAAPDLLEGMTSLVDQAIGVGRRVTSRLRPGILDDLGLAAAAEWLGADLERRTGIECRVVLPETEPELSEPLATAMFRILQEALTNVLRHAGADRVQVALEADDECISLTVSDNGVGFNAGRECGGFGVLGMRERVRAFDGAFDVVSVVGEGTTIRVALPRTA